MLALRPTRQASVQRRRCWCTNPERLSTPRRVSLLLRPRTPQHSHESASGEPSHLPLRHPTTNTLAAIVVSLRNPTGFVAPIARPARRQCRQRVQVSEHHLVAAWAAVPHSSGAVVNRPDYNSRGAAVSVNTGRRRAACGTMSVRAVRCLTGSTHTTAPHYWRHDCSREQPGLWHCHRP